MKSAAFLIALAVGAAQAGSDPGHPPHRAPTVKSKTVDLDLTLDFADEVEPAPKVAVLSAPASHAWIYWAMGATVAAGGLGWYLHENPAKEPVVTRNDQVFTDDR